MDGRRSLPMDKGSRGSLLGPAAQKSHGPPSVHEEVADDQMESLAPKGAQIKMPAQQAARVTKAYNKLLEMRSAGSAEAVVLNQIETVWQEVSQLRAKCDQVHPADAEQAEFKKVWMEKYLLNRESYLSQLREEAHPQEEVEVESCIQSHRSDASVASSVRRAVIQAEADHAKLELRMKQLADQQERRRQILVRRRLEAQRQEEEEQALQDQKERDEVEQELEGVRVRHAALHKAMSEAASQLGEERVELERQPTEAWLRSARSTTWTAPPAPPSVSRARPQGGFVAVSSPPRPAATTTTQDQLLQHIILSQAKLPVFKGDPLDFLWFRKAFEAQVSSVTGDPERRLYLLLQQLQGQPYDLVKGCQLLPPSDGYDRAMGKLEERYGHPVRQAMAFRNRLLTWTNVRTVTDLENFNVQLQLCHDVKLAGSGLAELDSPATLLQLAAKLSTKLQLAWQTKAYDIETNHRREATFDDFTRFIDRQAGLRSHPVYGKLNGERDREQRSDPKGFKVAGTLAGSNTETTVFTRSQTDKASESSTGKPQERIDAFKPPCLLCEGKHPTAKCNTTKLTKKEKYSRLQGLCFACLKSGHMARDCPARATCATCQGKHPTVLHSEPRSAQSSGGLSGASEHIGKEAEKAGRTEDVSAKAMATSDGGDYAVSTLPIQVWSTTQEQPITVYAVLDPASTATFITDELANQLQARPSRVEIGVQTMTDDARMAVGVTHELYVADMAGHSQFHVPAAYTVEKLPFNTKIHPSDIGQWSHLRQVPLRYDQDAPIAMLIGLNVPGAIRPLDIVQGQEHEPYAVKTPLGWTVQGPVRACKGSRVTTCWTKVDVNNGQARGWSNVEAQLLKLYYQGFEGAYDFTTKGPSQDDQMWLELVRSSITRIPIEGQDRPAFQYRVDLPFRPGAETRLKDNEAQALKSLNALRLRFRKRPQFRKDYWAFVQKMIEAGYVEEVSNSEESCQSGQAEAERSTDDRQVQFYVPHHGVYHPKKPDKIRVVFNCANRFNGVALNDCLLPGPDLTNSLLGVLLRFRQYPVAFMADIESMFYRVQVPAQQRDALRFLWWRGEEDEEQGRYVIYRLKVHLFGAASSPSVANYALRRAAEDAHRNSMVGKTVKQSVERNFYVDDCLKSLSTEEEAITVAQGLIRACEYGGFRLTKFVSTSRALLQTLPQEELAKGLEKIDLNDKCNAVDLQERALGVSWYVQTDRFRFQTVDKEKSEVVSKRSVLSKLGSVYDPLGMASPVVIVARVLFRELTRLGIGWDENLEKSKEYKRYTEQWRAWEQGLGGLLSTSVPRCFARRVTKGDAEQEGSWQLHLFCDASVEAYAAVAYLRHGQGNEEASVTYVLGKARVTPPKVVTIPRLELTAAKLAIELAEILKRELELPITRRVFWSDSMTVLKYLRNQSRRFHVFVANRVCAILNASDVNEWRHVSSQDNPADEATRGVAADALARSLWITGPAFLTQPETQWPMELDNLDVVVRDDDPELRKEDVKTVVATSVEQEMSLIERIVARHSSAYKVRYVVAILRKMITWLLGRKSQHPGRVSVSDLNGADLTIVRCLQREFFAAEHRSLVKRQNVQSSSPLFRLSPVLREEDGIIVISSRVRVSLPIVPQGSFAERLVREAHEQQGHQGRQATTTALQRRYWVLGANKLVRSVVRRCPDCQRRHATPKTTVMAPLPDFRYTPSSRKAFHVTGVDYFGPFNAVMGQTAVKAYGVVFTCAVTRAIHLEVAEDLSGSSFINALRRFVARRGYVRKLISDNGTNFVGANTTLEQCARREIEKQKRSLTMTSVLRKRGIEWVFNAPGASHHGGFWERLIRSVRRILAVLLTKHTLTYEALITALCECEFILNNRPITPNSDDPEDFEALTPNHLLLGSNQQDETGPPGNFDHMVRALRHRWKQVQCVVNTFWRRWNQEYKTLLHQRVKWHDKARRSVQLNDAVLVVDPLLPREQWRLGRVVKVHASQKDGHVRVIDVQTKKGLLTRPITRVCLLETASE